MSTRPGLTLAFVTSAIVCLMLAVPLYCFAEGDLGATPQLLTNGDFEHGAADGAAADWGIWPPAATEAGVSSLRDAEVKHSGAYSGRLCVTRDDFKGMATWHHIEVPVEVGQELILTFWVKALDVVDHAGCDVQLRLGSKIVGSAAVAETWKGSFGWRQITHRFVIPTGTDRICVVPLLYGKGTVWFDDVKLYGTPSLAPCKVDIPPKIDGNLDDAVWQAKAGGDEPSCVASGFALSTGAGLPQRATTAWAAYDKDNLYFAFRCEKKPGDKLKKTIRQRDGAVWVDDDVELFLNPAGDRSDYYQFVVNALGTQYESHRTDAGWNTNWKAAAQDGKDAWTVEIAIPVKSLPLDLTTGQDWCANFGRADTLANEASSWACTFGGFHNATRFGRLTNLMLDLVPFYVKDAGGRFATVQNAYREAMAGLTPASAPASIAAPILEREPKIKATLDKFSGLLQDPAAVSAADWKAFRPQLTALSDDISDLRAASLRLRAYTIWRDALGQAPQFGLATASPMVKVLKTGNDFRGQVSREVKLAAARNEYESAQVIAVSLSDADLPDCRAEITPLQGPGGAVIGVQNLKLSLVGYVKTAHPGYATSFVGDWPDPLMPNAPFTLKAGEMQPIWLRAYVPAGTPAGDYRGKLTVTGGGSSLAMTVALHVFNFDLPRRQHLATPFGCDPGTLSQWYTASRDYQANMPPEVFNRWNQFLLDYRLTPTSIGGAYVKESLDPQGRLAYDFSINDRLVAAVADRLPPDGVAMAGIGQVGWASANGAQMQYAQQGHSGKRCGKVLWPKTKEWASLEHGMRGAFLAAGKCRAFRFWVKALDPAFEKESIVAYVNAFPGRWSTTFPVGSTQWHEVRIPIEQYRHNETGKPLTLDGLGNCNNFQFVIAQKDQAISFLVDDIVAECDKGDVLVDDFELATELNEMRAQMGAQLNHWKAKGWFKLGHVYAKDEIRPEEYEQITPLYRKALQVAPDAPLMQTYYINRTPRELIGLAKIWCAITSIYDADFSAARQKAGEKVWLYVCCGPQPPFANFFIDQPGSDHRILFWQTWQRGCTGLLYWATNYWHGMTPQKASDPHWPDIPWDQEKVATYHDYKVNGDGFLIYPGRNWEPLPSVRLENIRDGIEDYEYLWLLRERRPQSKLLQVGEDISRDLTHFTKDPTVIEQRRLQIAKEIEASVRNGR